MCSSSFQSAAASEGKTRDANACVFLCLQVVLRESSQPMESFSMGMSALLLMILPEKALSHFFTHDTPATKGRLGLDETTPWYGMLSPEGKKMYLNETHRIARRLQSSSEYPPSAVGRGAGHGVRVCREGGCSPRGLLRTGGRTS